MGYSWMQLQGKPRQNETSQKEIFTYTREMDQLGIGDNSNIFPEHVAALVDTNAKFKGWKFNQAMGSTADNSSSFKKYISDCSSRWDAVKVRLCSNYGAEVLNTLRFL